MVSVYYYIYWLVGSDKILIEKKINRSVRDAAALGRLLVRRILEGYGWCACRTGAVLQGPGQKAAK